MNLYQPTISGSLVVSGSATFSGSVAIQGTLTAAITGSITSASFAQTAILAQTASSISGLNQNVQITGSLTTTGQIVAQTLNVQQVTSSIVYSSGSNVFGNQLTNTQQFTGSLQVTSSNASYFLGSGVGIGTTSPQSGYILDVKGFSQFGNSTYSNVIRLGDQDTDSTIIQSVSTAGAAKNLTFWNTSERMRITSTGNVGIGVTSPSYALDVANSSSPSLRVRNGALGGTATLLLETANDFSGTCQTYVKCIGATSNGTSQLAFGTAGASGDTTATERMRITSAGNVGIGTSDFTSIGSTDKSLRVQASSGTAYIQAISGDSGSSVSLYSGASSGDNPSLLFRNSLRFGTTTDNVTGGYTERMRITTAGALLIGTTVDIAGQPSINIGGAGSSYFTLYNNYSGNSVGLEMTNNANTLKVQFFGSSGNYYFAGSNISDRRSKTNIQEIGEGLSKLLQLKPSTFAYNANPGIIKGGFIAQEVLEVTPEFVTIPEEETEMMGVDYNGLLALAVKAIQELKAEVEELKAKIN